MKNLLKSLEFQSYTKPRLPPVYALPVVGMIVRPTAEELDVELGWSTGLAVLEGLIDGEDILTVEAVVGFGATTGAEVGDVTGVEAGFAGAAVFWKQVHALDNLETGTPARLLGIFSLGARRNFGQKAAASLEKRSKARRLLSS